SVEAVGVRWPDVDIELIALCARLWRELGRAARASGDQFAGTAEARRAYRERLVEYLNAHHDQLDADSRRRLQGNPLRVLDSKNPEMRALIDGAPLLTEHLDPESHEHFQGVCTALEGLGIPFRVNPRLVRGLDYYSRTVFEWITDALGAQDAVCSGGRYDGLIAQLGGESTPGIGFAMGIERLVALLTQGGPCAAP
ncbi:histidyl-tRNA synthetase, partial [mine drainage metagenome]